MQSLGVFYGKEQNEAVRPAARLYESNSYANFLIGSGTLQACRFSRLNRIEL